MNEPYKISFVSILALVFVLPLFFLPSSLLSIGISKIALLVFGSALIFLVFIYETLRIGRLYVPSTYMLWGVLLLPLSYLASSLLGVNSHLSLFGYNLEIGTFGLIATLFVLFGVVSVVFLDSVRIIKAYGVLLLSLALVLVFGIVKILSHGSWLNLGVFSGVMGNPIGAWTDYAVCFGFLTIASLFAVVMLPLSKGHKVLLYIVMGLSMFLLMVVNFSIAWQLVFGASLVSLIYFVTIEKKIARTSDEGIVSPRLAPSIVILLVSLFFAINPMISSNSRVGDYISNSFGVANVDVRPSLSSTFAVAGSVLKAHPLTGSGPNTFSGDWILYKPAVINSTGFWNTAFPYGYGFLPTQVATTGLLGTVLWALFLGMLILLGVKALVKNSSIKSERFLLVSSFVGALFLWVAAFIYIPSAVVLALAFLLTGLFVASSNAVGLIKGREIVFGKNLVVNFGSVLVAILLILLTGSLGYVSYQKIASAAHFQKALNMANTAGSSIESIESELGKASDLGPQDAYFSALSQLEFARAQSILTTATGTPEQAKAAFEGAISRSIAGAQAAASVNPGNYQNWIALGSIYAALVPKPFNVAGAYESAKSAYAEADKLNPSSPEVSLLQARLELDKGNVTTARKYISDSIQKKQDYAEAYFLLTQLEIVENHLSEAIKSAQTAALLSPNNAGIFFELGLLKYSSQDYKGAAEALSQALSIIPNYANAKYYLGLSLDQLHRREEAAALFADLAKDNPDNQSVLQILNNLKAGHDAFYQSVNTSKPTSRTNPPIPTKSTKGQ